jgi:hypothetical protein
LPAEEKRKWLDAVVASFSDRIHPVDAEIAVRAGRLLPRCQASTSAIAPSERAPQSLFNPHE